MTFLFRPATTADVPQIFSLVEALVAQRILLGKELVALYEAVPEFTVAVDAESGEVVGAGAIHVMWEDLAEVRTLVVRDDLRHHGIGHELLTELLARAAGYGVGRVFCLTFEVEFFSRHGFEEVLEPAVDDQTYAELLRSPDEGIAEFLELSRVKQNTLGNTRMIARL